MKNISWDSVSGGVRTVNPFSGRRIRPANDCGADVERRQTRADQLHAQVSKLLANMRIAVIYGGDKSRDNAVIYPSHNPRSWKSYEFVAHDIRESLERLGAHDVVLLPDDMHLGERLLEHGIHFAWLNTGGVQGYCAVSHASAQLEMLGVPYIGHDPLTAGILDSKHVFKRQLIGAGVPTARFMTWHGAHGTLRIDEGSPFHEIFQGFEGPFIVKPVSGRASLNVEYSPDISCVADLAQAVFEKTQNHVLIEQYLGGREFCVAICGPTVYRGGILTRLDGPFTFAHVERLLQADERIFTSMDQRPITGDRVRALDMEDEREIIEELDGLARATFSELDLETLVRLDVRANHKGKLYILEANPKPDLKAPTQDGVTSLIAEGLSNYGMSYDDLIFSLLSDRIDVLFGRRRGSVNHLLGLLTACEG